MSLPGWVLFNYTLLIYPEPLTQYGNLRIPGVFWARERCRSPLFSTLAAKMRQIFSFSPPISRHLSQNHPPLLYYIYPDWTLSFARLMFVVTYERFVAQYARHAAL